MLKIVFKNKIGVSKLFTVVLMNVFWEQTTFRKMHLLLIAVLRTPLKIDNISKKKKCLLVYEKNCHLFFNANTLKLYQ